MTFHTNIIIKTTNPGDFQFFKIQVIIDNTAIDSKKIFGHLKGIVDTYKTRTSAPVGVLPSDYRARWAHLYSDLQKGNFKQSNTNQDKVDWVLFHDL